MIRKSAIELKSLMSLLNSSNFSIKEGQVQLPKFRIKGRLSGKKKRKILWLSKRKKNRIKYTELSLWCRDSWTTSHFINFSWVSKTSSRTSASLQSRLWSVLHPARNLPEGTLPSTGRRHRFSFPHHKSQSASYQHFWDRELIQNGHLSLPEFLSMEQLQKY